MNKAIILLLLFPFAAHSQNTFKAIIKNEDTKEPLKRASVRIKDLERFTTTDSNGVVIMNDIPNGKHEIEITNIGYDDLEEELHFPLSSNDTLQLLLESNEAILSDVVVSTTRTGRSIGNTPTRVEVIAQDEIHEEATMHPGDIRMLLAETTGIQAQQTSAASGTANIRIEGLDGRYTQLLKDGFPIYSGEANGLGLLQTPPLDLQQVEIIKGSASTLYGGGAIAGLINLLTKTPSDKRQLNFNINGTSAKGLDINGFYSEKFNKTGITLFASRNSNEAYAPSNTVFTAIPKFERYTFNPKLFLYFNDKTKLVFGINTTFEDRLGGDINFIEGKGDSTHTYFEKNKTKRVSAELSFMHSFNDKSSFNIKNSASYFNRAISSNNYAFNGTQYSSYTEATYIIKSGKTDWVAGINIITDRFAEDSVSIVPLRNYTQTTMGGFIQNTWNAANWLTLETGLREDYVNEYGAALLPHFSSLFKVAKGLSSRITAGLGYKPPTIFTEESEKILYKNVLPVNSLTNSLERSYGINGDINYATTFDELHFSINQFFFYTHVNHPLLLDTVANGFYQFQNINGNITSSGAETNARFGYNDFELYLGYTYINAKLAKDNIVIENPLTPKHRFNTAIVYEQEDKWRIGYELYYFSKQVLTDGSIGRHYWLTGFVAEKFWDKFSLYANFENLGNVRQTKFESIYSGTVSNPIFKDIYAPLDGFVFNGGVIVKL